jgi:leucyl-tRNA synthetase
MTHLYQPRDIEQKWQKAWEAKNVYAFDLEQAKDPFYLLVMFPYPSGAKLHVGHWFQYSIPDSYGRFLRMRGKEVFHPMGFDAFGLPAENYAIKTGTPPAMSTRENVTNMIEQYKKMGVMYDWNYALNTSEPEYYKWTQWLFLQMFKNQLAYKKLGNVNWCPKDQTVLANEQVHDGVCERCGTEVIQKPLEQWYWQITKYAEALLNGLDGLEWPEKTKLMQRNWIGKSEGAELMFEVAKNDQDEKRPPKAGLTGDSYSTDKPIDVSRGVNPPANMRTCHLVFTPLKRMHAFEDSGAATQILRALKDVALQQDILIHEAAAMPDHVHLLVSFKKGRNLEHDIVMRLKGTSSRLF